jgi:hypothetical protein
MSGYFSICTAPCSEKEVHVIGIYKASNGPSKNGRSVQKVTVTLRRRGEQVLVLSAYEPIRWKINIASGVRLRAVHLLGFHKQRMARMKGSRKISITTGAHAKGACGYAWPSNGRRCDTNKLLTLARKYAGGEITSFHGCYEASRWTIDANFRAKSGTSRLSGQTQYSFYPDCQRLAPWTAVDFTTLGTPTCSGERYSRFNSKYNLWVGAIQCGSASRYKLYLSEEADSPFLEIADYAGHGQDHCELINPDFRLPDPDLITSGGCTECALGSPIDIQDVDVYARAGYGESFTLVSSTIWADLTTDWYQCGVTIP